MPKKKVSKVRNTKVHRFKDESKGYYQTYSSHDWIGCLCKVYNQRKDIMNDNYFFKGAVLGILQKIDMSSDYPFTIKTGDGGKSFRYCEPFCRYDIKYFDKKYCNFNCKEPEKYIYKGKNIVQEWEQGVPCTHDVRPDTPLRRWLVRNRVKITGSGYDYKDVFGIKENCVYSVYCGDPHGYLFCLGHSIILYPDPSRKEELELAKELWEKYKGGYEQYISSSKFKEIEAD
ncbi:MAG: hypothetical protein IJ880_11665 [Bacilli bacterium]|nr:hypothetical protein [Bacilli bacterium]